MAYFNGDTDGASFYPTFSTSYEFDAYPSHTSASEQGNDQNFDAFANGWSMGSQQNYLAGSLTGLGTGAGFEPESSVQDNGYDLSPYQEYYWPVTGQYTQSYPSCVMGQNSSFVSDMAAFEAPAAAPAPTDNTPFNCWGGSENGQFTGTFYANVQAPYQHSNGVMQTQRYRPYEAPRTFSNEYANAEAGPSNLAPPLVPYTAPPSTYPSGGTSEATADAEKDQTVTEEHAAPTVRRPRGSGPPRGWRTRYQRDIHRLCVWAKKLDGLAKPPSHKKALEIALEVVGSTRIPVYAAPRLKKGDGARTTQGKRAPDAEHRRRMSTRQLNEELSRYYRLGVSQSTWDCPGLLKKVLDHIENLPKLPAVPSA